MTFDPAALFAAGESGAWYDPSDSATLWQDTAGTVPVSAAGQAVALIQDKSGNGSHLSQATTARMPTYQLDSSGRPYLLFDGIDDVLNASLAITIPFDRLSAIRQLSWSLNERIFAGSVSSEPRLYQTGAPPSIGIYAGSTSVQNAGLAIGANGIVTERFIAGASKLAVNRKGSSSGNAGSNGLTALRVGASSAAGGAAAHFRLYGSIVRAGLLSDEDIAQVRDWLADKAGVTFLSRRAARHSGWL